MRSECPYGRREKMYAGRYVEIFNTGVLFRPNRADPDHEGTTGTPGQNVGRLRPVHSMRTRETPGHTVDPYKRTRRPQGGKRSDPGSGIASEVDLRQRRVPERQGNTFRIKADEGSLVEILSGTRFKRRLYPYGRSTFLF